MSLTKKINSLLYLIGTSVNFYISIKLMGEQYAQHLALFFLGIVINHLFLYKGIQRLLDISKKSKKTSLYLVAKSIVLMGIFFYVYQTMPEKILLCTLVYIFQLIILVLSIKKVAYKIKDNVHE